MARADVPRRPIGKGGTLLARNRRVAVGAREHAADAIEVATILTAMQMIVTVPACIVRTIGGLLIHSAIRYVRIAVLLSLLVRL